MGVKPNIKDCLAQFKIFYNTQHEQLQQFFHIQQLLLHCYLLRKQLKAFFFLTQEQTNKGPLIQQAAQNC
jgi:hypothetical protein